MNDKIKLTIVVILFALAALIFFYYFVLRNTTKNVNDKKPYSEIIGHKLVSINDAVLINNSTSRFLKDYNKELSNIESIDTTNVIYKLIPKGSEFYFEKAVQLKKGVSGITSAYLLGEVTLKNTTTTFKIVYNFGYLNTLCVDEPCNYWVFKKAPWQVKKISKKYFE